jgi:hypothetical protein
MSDPLLDFLIDRLPDGEVSGYLADIVDVGDELELRGPIGGWVVWPDTTPGLGMIGGGSGVVPSVSMLRHAAAVGSSDLLRLAASGQQSRRAALRRRARGGRRRDRVEPHPERDGSPRLRARRERHRRDDDRRPDVPGLWLRCLRRGSDRPAVGRGNTYRGHPRRTLRTRRLKHQRPRTLAEIPDEDLLAGVEMHDVLVDVQ